MNTLFQSLLQHPLAELVGRTLIHFLWQAFVVAVPVGVFLWLLRRSSAQSRYTVACCGLIAMAILPVATLTTLISQVDVEHEQKALRMASEPTLVTVESSSPWVDSADLRSDDISAVTAQRIGPTLEGSPTSTSRLSEFSNWVLSLHSARWTPVLAAVWLAGVTVLSLRLLGGLWRIQRMRLRGEFVDDRQLIDVVQRLARRMKVRPPIRLLQSADSFVPIVIGFLRPAMILPLSIASGMTTVEIESILAHELAHIRRRDWLVNLIQSSIETLLFYHPAVWWLSAVIRRERENCCDDIAVAVCGDRLALAKALSRMEESRCTAANLALSASTGSLVHRIRRILQPHTACPAANWPAGLMALLVATTLAGGVWVSAISAAPVIQPQENRSEGRPEGQMIVEQSGYPPASEPSPSGAGRVLASHTYDLSRRESSGWIQVDQTQVPVDHSVEQDGVKVYVTLMFDVVAVDSATGKVVWKWDWNKSSPMWQTVSILELDFPTGKELVVELLPQLAEENKDSDSNRLYLRLRTGEKIVPPMQADKLPPPALSIVSRDNGRTTMATLSSRKTGRTDRELIERFSASLDRHPGLSEAWITDQETLVSSPRVEKLLEVANGVAMDSSEIILNLPEGSGLRVEFSGQDVSFTSEGDETAVVVTAGQIQLIDSGGVIRASVSAGDGAEGLSAVVREIADELTLQLQAGFRESSLSKSRPIVQTKLNLATGAPKEEVQPPHRAIRYFLEHEAETPNSPMKVKMRWHYEMRRLMDEARVEEEGSDTPASLDDQSDISKVQRSQGLTDTCILPDKKFRVSF